MKKILIVAIISLGVFTSKASIPYEGVAHDAASFQPLYSRQDQGKTVTAFIKANEDVCPEVVKQIKAQIKSQGNVLGIAEREGSGRGYAIRQGIVHKCQDAPSS